MQNFSPILIPLFTSSLAHLVDTQNTVDMAWLCNDKIVTLLEPRF